jgi:dephospho-CoA kinase
MKETVWIGLCGRSGSGKGYVGSIFAALGVPVIDTDAVYRRMSGPAHTPTECMTELVSAFGERILNPDNSLNRRAMADIVFAPGGDAAREQLNRITHSHILRESRRLAQAYTEEGHRFVLIDAPLLFESSFDTLCRYTVCVTAPDSVCVKRITARDGITEEEAIRRLSAQITAEELILRCDYAIVNDGSAAVRPQVEAVIQAIQCDGGEQ